MKNKEHNNGHWNPQKEKPKTNIFQIKEIKVIFGNFETINSLKKEYQLF